MISCLSRPFVVVSLLVLALGSAACGKRFDQLNRSAASITYAAVVASEESRCEVRPAPCLSEAHFRNVNAELVKVTSAGKVYTELRLAGKASVADVTAFLSTAAAATAQLSQTYRDGSIAQVLAELAKLQAAAAKIIGGTQ